MGKSRSGPILRVQKMVQKNRVAAHVVLAEGDAVSISGPPRRAKRAITPHWF